MWSALSVIWLLGCSGEAPETPEAAVVADPAEPPAVAALAVNQLAAGYAVTLEATGVPVGARVMFLRSGRGPGAGPCRPGFASPCAGILNPASLGEVTADANGVAALSATLPITARGTVWMQAMWMGGGNNGSSNVVERIIARDGVDHDSDGADDAQEVGELGTDPLVGDTDLDGALDGVEASLGIDPLSPDSDGDGLLDGVDVWPLRAGPFDPFVPVDTVVSDSTASLPDPEMDSGSDQIVWQTDDGARMFVADIDPTNGDIVPLNGRGTLIDTTVAPISAAKNGPEWAVGAAGSQVVYAKEVAGVYRLFHAVEGPGGWTASMLDGSIGGRGPIGSQDPGDPTPRVVYLDEPVPGQPVLLAREIDDETTDVQLPEWLQFPRWVVGERVITGVRDVGGLGRVVRFDMDTGSYERLTWDDVDHGSVFFFQAPELGGESLFFTTHGVQKNRPTSLWVWRLRNGAWTPIKEIPTPPGRPYVISPEPFEWAGRSWVSFISADEPINSNNGRADVWMAGLAPGNDVIRRISADTDIVRKDPESYVGGVRPWVYYTRVFADGRRVLHRCELGL